VQRARIVVWLKYYGPSVIVFVAIALQNLYTLYNFLSLTLSLYLCYSLHNICSWVREHSLGLGAFPWLVFSLFHTRKHVTSLSLPLSLSISFDDNDNDENISRIAKSTNRCFTHCSESSFWKIHLFTFTFREFKKYISLFVFIIWRIWNYISSIYSTYFLNRYFYFFLILLLLYIRYSMIFNIVSYE